ncbi:RNA polymerase II transcription factor B subunit 2 [Fennellomyces sp. T-0311]|nr:RNA polymerase II transcription factor B subunit 2 [Fennellomyces sp. T-0311]
MSVDNFKTNIYEYLETLPTFTFLRLFEKPATCLAIFRLLPSIGRQIVMSFLYVETDIQVQDVNNWVNKDGQRKLAEALHKLSRLRILDHKNSTLIMNETFRQEFKNALTGGGTQQSFGLPCATTDKHHVDIAFLDQYATQQWESILHYMVGTSSNKRPSRGVLNLLERSQLMQNSPDGPGTLQITNKGFQFLLQDVNTQVWAFLLQYLDMAEVLQMDLVEVLNFLFQLGSLELGENYSVETLTQTQQQMLEDLRDYGIVYQRKRGSRRYYPTRLATTLTSGSVAIAGAALKNVTAGDTSKTATGITAAGEEDSEQGFVILETNYRIYAYTESPLQIAVLNLFVQLQSRFRNMVAGVITRDSVRNALLKGITADQIISYLQTHAHPQMRKKTPILPLTVVDQIRLWEMERCRLKTHSAYLYHEFNMQADFDAAEKHAKDLEVLLWSNPKKRTMVITQGGHDQVKGFVKRRLQNPRPS